MAAKRPGLTQALGASMKSRDLTKILMVLAGSGLAIMGLNALWISYIGKFSQGRDVVVATGCFFLVIAAPLLAFPFPRNISKFLGAIALLAFAAAMVWLAFRPSNPAAHLWTYQVAGIALASLLLSRIALVLRSRKGQSGT